MPVVFLDLKNVTLEVPEVFPLVTGKESCIMWHKVKHVSVTPRDPQCPSSEPRRSQGINGRVSAFWVMLQDLPWQQSSSGTGCVRCSQYRLLKCTFVFSVKVHCPYRSKLYRIPSCPDWETHMAVKMKDTTQYVFPPVFSLPCPPLLCFLSLSLHFFAPSLSALIAICAIIMARHWEFDWCLSDSNKQGWCCGMLSRWEKIKQIRDHILWRVRTAFVEWIL